MRTKLPIAISGIAGIAATVIFSLPAAAADQPATTIAPATTTTAPSKSDHIALSTRYSDYRVRQGDSAEFTGPCGSVRHGELVEIIGAGFLDSGFSYHEESCGTGGVRPTWHGTVSKTARNGSSLVHYVASGGDFGAKVAVVGGVPPVTTPTRPTSPPVSTQPAPPTRSGAPAQQVPVKPKGAPQTGGGAMADVVSTWS